MSRITSDTIREHGPCDNGAVREFERFFPRDLDLSDWTLNSHKNAAMREVDFQSANLRGAYLSDKQIEYARRQGAIL